MAMGDHHGPSKVELIVNWGISLMITIQVYDHWESEPWGVDYTTEPCDILVHHSRLSVTIVHCLLTPYNAPKAIMDNTSLFVEGMDWCQSHYLNQDDPVHIFLETIHLTLHISIP